MNLNHLRVFHAIAAAGSITAAARTLQVSQPAVSKQLSDLEGALGTHLVDRLPRGVRLTTAGRVLAEHAARIFGVEQTAEVELAALLGVRRGQLSLGASTTIGSYLVPRVFGAFRRLHPALRLELEIGNTATIHDLVRQQVVELGLTEGFVTDDDLTTKVFDQDEMVAIAAPGDPVLARTPLTTKELLALPLLMRERGSGTREVIEAAFAKKRLVVEPVMSLGSTEALKNAVAAGLGIAIVSRLAVELELVGGSLVAIEVSDLVIRRALHLVELRGKSRSPAASRFVELLGQSRPKPR
ncbi:MAG: LysR family transcriptional regulator [Deltaproteobacteria bacterium]|nr:LysR family transcriptional regulator [Deltaproteobacteria bacterium]MDQ3295162.1 LysR substrate-binding domain-containing protein [Myxococcota bacterium]